MKTWSHMGSVARKVLNALSQHGKSEGSSKARQGVSQERPAQESNKRSRRFGRGVNWQVSNPRLCKQ